MKTRSEKNHRRNRWPAARCALALLILGVLPLHADISPEYQIKAAYLYNFTKFVDWPAARFADETSPIVIGVLGRNPFGGELEKITKGHQVNGRSIVVKSIATPDDARAVHLVFVPAGEERGFELAAAALPQAAVVTIGESRRFAAQGGMITFVRENDHVTFEINIAAAERGGLKISSQLQKLAKAIWRRP